MATFRINKTKDFTVMSNYHFRDKNISLKAKGLLSQMLSLPENWDYSINGLSAINKEGVDAIRTTVIELEKAGYIVRQRIRNSTGHLIGTEYIVYETPLNSGTQPTLENPTLDNPTLDNPTLDNPTLDNPTLDNPTLDNPTLENPTQLNKDLNNYLIDINTNPSINQSNKQMDTDVMDSLNKTRDLIKKNIDYNFLIQQYGLLHGTDIDEIVELMTETVVLNQKPININGNAFPAEVVKSQLLKLDVRHIEYVLDIMVHNKAKITNIKAYLLSVLYNSRNTMSNYYENEINRDVFGV